MARPGPEQRPVVLATPHGDARATTYAATVAGTAARCTLLLGHGAGGGVAAPDLVAMAAGLPAHGVDVVLVEQPWRVAGRRLAPRPAVLDDAFVAVAAQLAPQHPLLVGGRSAGARVACRTAAALGAAGIVALAFPLHPPGRPGRSRAAELVGAGVPTVVVQGTRDTFGGPDVLRAAVSSTSIEVVDVPGADHGFSVRARDGGEQARAEALRRAVADTAAWLGRHAWPTGRLGTPR